MTEKPQNPTIRSLLSDSMDRAVRYAENVDDRPVAPDTAALADLARLDEPLPADPTDPAETLALLDELGSPATVASTGSRYFGFVTGGTLPVALAASWLTTAWDQNAALPVMSPIASALHDTVRGWLVDVLSLPSSTAVSFVSGATMANASALAAARDHVLAQVGWDVQRDGLRGSPALTVVVGEQVHSTVIKGLGLLGLGREHVHRVPTDGQGRMRADLLPDVPGPVIVCAQAGEVNTGAFDPFPEIVAWARERQGWVHVDGAFGLWARADPDRAKLTRGSEDADSWATDGHKWLNVAYDCGMALVRDPAALRRSFASVAGYLPPEHGFEAMHHTPQSSQRARQVEVWAVLRSLGRSGIQQLIANGCGHATRIARALTAGGLSVLNDVVLNQVLVGARDDDTVTRLVHAVQSEGTCWCGPTRWKGRAAMRISVSGWNTTAEDADRSVEAILACAREVGAV